VLPLERLGGRRLFNASSAPSPTAPACSKLMLAGMCVIGNLSGTHMYSACAPVAKAR